MARNILKYFGSSHADFLHADGLKSTAILIDHMDCKPGESILEIGFGTGATLVELAHHFPETHFFGLEQSKIMYETAQNRINACGIEEKISVFIVEDEHAPFVENQFDKIYLESVLAIQSEESLRKLLQNIQKWLKPAGILICNETIWLPTTPNSQINEINEKCLQRFGIIQANGDFPYPADWLQLFESYGLKVIQSNAISEEIPSFSLEQNNHSRRFTQRGKIKSGLNLKMRKEWKEYERAMDEILPDNAQLMEGWLFKLTNEKK